MEVWIYIHRIYVYQRLSVLLLSCFSCKWCNFNNILTNIVAAKLYISILYFKSIMNHKIISFCHKWVNMFIFIYSKKIKKDHIQGLEL